MVSIPLAVSITVGGLLAALAIFLSIRHIYQHLKHYSRPEYQLHIVRILAMVPIYSLTSWLQLIVQFERTKLSLELGRDSYEAYVIYNFFVLLIKYAGGDRHLCRYLENQPRISHSWPINLWVPPIQPGPAFLNFVRASVLQFVIVKPAGALLKLYVLENSSEKVQFAVRILMYIVNNLSIWLAVYALVMFYHAAHELLEPYHPLPKFISVKAVVFFSFWQGVAIQIAIASGVLHDVEGVTVTEQATGLQDILICLEMAVAAVAHNYIFSVKEYQSLEANEKRREKHRVLRNFGDIFDFRDVLSDVKDRINGGVGFAAELRDGAPVASIESVLDEDLTRPSAAYGAPRSVSQLYDVDKGRKFGQFSRDAPVSEMFTETKPLLARPKPRDHGADAV